MLAEISGLKHACLNAIFHVRREVGDLIGHVDQLRFQRRPPVKEIRAQLRMLGRGIIARVLDDAFAHAAREIQAAKSGITNLEVLDDAQRVEVVVEAQAEPAHGFVERLFTGMAKGRVPDVMDQGQRFRQVFVQLKSTGDGAGDLRHFHGVREPAAKVIGVAVGEDLGLSRQAAEARAWITRARSR